MDKYEQRRTALKALTDQLGRGGISQIANKAGLEPSYVSRLLYDPEKPGRKRIGENTYEKISKAYPGWDHNSPTNDLGPSIQTPLRQLKVINNLDEAEHEIIAIPRYTLKASAGTGLPVFDVDDRGEPNYARMSWVKRHGYKPENLFTIVAIGDSMEPEIRDGDSLIVHRQTEIETGKLMIICYMGECFVKQVLRQFDGSLNVHSFNPNYRDKVIEPEQMEELAIVGRVVNISRNS